MTYHERDLLVSRSSQPYLPKRIFNNSNNRSSSSRLYPSHILRIECTAEERHFLGHIPPYTIDSTVKPIRYTMNEQIKPVQFRSEIILHNNPETDLHIQRLRVDFHYHDDPPADAILNPPSSPLSSSHSQPLHIPRPLFPSEQEQKTPNSKRKFRPTVVSPSQGLLHQWIDDICANEQLMSNDDIVFFIKNGEFFARI